jgi:2-polyprenyl-3-methyl-5-hydroxy-6-metoxy-1,4-benzoquinol methylase
MKKISTYTMANKAAWNEIMPMHQKVNRRQLDAAFMQQGHTTFHDDLRHVLSTMDVQGKNIAHLCCNNGIELMSFKNLGADLCVGFDICDLAVEEAKDRAIKTGIDCKFYCTDVFEISEEHNAQFDIVFISSGCLGWIPDLSLFFAKASALLNAGGQILFHEIHPFSEMLPADADIESNPLEIIEPYFKDEPYEDTIGLDYIGKSKAETTTQYWFVWTISEILMGLITNNFSIDFFQEYENDISMIHNRNQETEIAMPLSYILIASKL